MDTNQSQRMVLHVHINLIRGRFKVIANIAIDYGNIGNPPYHVKNTILQFSNFVTNFFFSCS